VCEKLEEGEERNMLLGVLLGTHMMAGDE
jgi:hypothetical protein